MNTTTLALTEAEDLRDYAASISRMLQDHSPIQQLRDLRDDPANKPYDEALWNRLCQQELIPDPQQAWAELPLSVWSRTFVELGRQLAVSPLLDAILAARVCAQANLKISNEQRDGMLKGTQRLALLGFDKAIAVQAERENGVWQLNGEVIAAPYAAAADGYILRAQSVEQGKSLICFLQAQKGIETTATQRALDSSGSANLVISEVKVTDDHVCEDSKRADLIAEECRNIANLLLAAQLQGASEAAFERTLEWLRTREQFGVLIGTFQSLQHRAAESYIQLQKLIALNSQTLKKLEQSTDDLNESAALCKYYACRVSRHISGEAIQMHGGIGMTDECDIGFFLKSAVTLGPRFGGQDTQLHHWQQQRGKNL